jgi:opacity protein-like surface antigen
MRNRRLRAAFLFLELFGLDIAARAQTDVALSVYGAFTGTTSGNGIQQSPSNSAGGIIELRHIRNPIIGYEATYSYNRGDQSYTPLICPVTGTTPGCAPTTTYTANAHEITGDWVASVKLTNLRPFAVVGLGLLLDVPSSGQGSGTQTSTKPVFVYGAGLDWGLLPHIGARIQYRGNLYKAPDLTTLYTSSERFLHTAEPMVGAYFRF